MFDASRYFFALDSMILIALVDSLTNIYKPPNSANTIEKQNNAA